MSRLTKPLISVLMTVYNREEYIEEAITSVLESTYQNWELIIVDDKSVDNSLKIAKKYTERDSRISVYANESNIGDYPNRNKAASYANGEYIIYVDADDRIYPFGIEQMIFFMQKHTSSAIGICRPPNPRMMYPIEYTSELALKEHFLNRSFLNNAPGSVIIRKSCFDAQGGFPTYRHISDSLLWIRLAMKYNVVVLPREVNWSRRHDSQELEFRKNKIEPIIQRYLILRRMITEHDCPLNEPDCLRALVILDRAYIRNTLSFIKRFKILKAVNLLLYYRSANAKV